MTGVLAAPVVAAVFCFGMIIVGCGGLILAACSPIIGGVVGVMMGHECLIGGVSKKIEEANKLADEARKILKADNDRKAKESNES